MNGEQDESVGSVGEEAAKLLAALQEWASQSGSEYAGAAAVAAGGATNSLRALDEHVATEGADCRYCPICQLISTVRAASPEVRHHLSAAASSLLQAAAGAMATDVPGQDERRRSPRVDKIDLDGDEEWGKES